MANSYSGQAYAELAIAQGAQQNTEQSLAIKTDIKYLNKNPHPAR
ncbi:hypothetical protein [Nostoc sp.]